jgi:hypothetical protein
MISLGEVSRQPRETTKLHTHPFFDQSGLDGVISACCRRYAVTFEYHHSNALLLTRLLCPT